MKRTTWFATVVAMLALSLGATPAQAATAPAPSAATTGVVSGVSLSSMSGGYVRTAGTTIANKVINGDVTFVGSDLTLRNVRVTGKAIFRGDNLTISDSEFGALALSGTDTVRINAVDVFGKLGTDGIQITSDTGPARDVVITNTWIHDPQVTSTSTYSGLRARGVDGLTLDNALIDLGAHQPQHNAAVLLENTNGGNRNITITGSRLLGGTYLFNTTATNLAVTGSVLGAGTAGYLGPDQTITTFTGNTTPSGHPLTYANGTITTSTTPAPEPEPTPAPEPEPTPAPEPEPTPAPTPEPTPAPTPEPTPAPEPDPTPAPEPTPSGAPSAATTGVVSGVSLSSMSGGTITTSSTTITNKVINGDAVFTGNNLTLRNVRITGKVLFKGDNLTISDSEFGALSLSGTDTVRIDRVDVFGKAGSDGMHITSDTGQVRDVVITNTWIHDPQVTSTSHYDGMQVRGVDGLTLDNVLIDLGAHQPQYTAALFLENANGGNRNITVDDSWILGGGYAFYNFASNVAITDTTFGGARWGHLFPSSQTATITTFTGNTDPTGATLKIEGTAFVTTTSATPDPTPAPEPDPTPAPEPTPSGAPSAATTGVVSGVSLSSMSGGTITTSSTTITNKVINGDAVFTGNNLTLRNVRITGKVLFKGDNLTISDSEFGALSLSGTDTVRIDRVDVFGKAGSDGMHITSDTGQVRDVVITNTWIHDPQVTSTSHYDGMQVRGVDGLTLDNVLIDLGPYKPQYTSALFLQDANGGNRNVAVSDSTLLGGGYLLNMKAANLSVTDSVLGNAHYDYLYPGQTITTFSGNTDPTGAPLTLAGGKITAGTVALAVDPLSMMAFSVAEPVTEPVAEPAVEPVTEPVAEPAVEPVAAPIAEPVAEPVTEPVLEAVPAVEPELSAGAELAGVSAV